VEAFNDYDLGRLLACLSPQATWITGTARFHGTRELTTLFENAFSQLKPKLLIKTMLVDGDDVACELRETYFVGRKAQLDEIAGFYQVRSQRITRARIYRQGFSGAEEL
jgi:hypothetical protein